MAKRISVNNLHKNTPDTFSKFIALLKLGYSPTSSIPTSSIPTSSIPTSNKESDKTKEKGIDVKNIQGEKDQIINEEIYQFALKHISEIEKEIDHKRDYNYSYFGIETLKNNGYLKKINGKCIDRPQHMLMMVALQLYGPKTYQEETFKLSGLLLKNGYTNTGVVRPYFGSGWRSNPKYNTIYTRKSFKWDSKSNDEYFSFTMNDFIPKDSEGDITKVLSAYNQMSNKHYTHASPTLFYSSTVKPQLSSCFLGNMEDSIDGIGGTILDDMKISKHAGGIGNSITKIRAKGSLIKGTQGRSDGIGLMIKMVNSTAVYVNQGSRRKGAFALYLEPWHAEAELFISMKRNTKGTDAERARDLFYGLWIPDLFMERVKEAFTSGNDTMWSLFCPNDVQHLYELYGEAFNVAYKQAENAKLYRTQVSAKSIWMMIMEAHADCGLPYMLYKDACNLKSNQKNIGTIYGSNLCSEIIQYHSPHSVAVCNLASISYPDHLSSLVLNSTDSVDKQLINKDTKQSTDSCKLDTKNKSSEETAEHLLFEWNCAVVDINRNSLSRTELLNYISEKIASHKSEELFINSIAHSLEKHNFSVVTPEYYKKKQSMNIESKCPVDECKNYIIHPFFACSIHSIQTPVALYSSAYINDHTPIVRGNLFSFMNDLLYIYKTIKCKRPQAGKTFPQKYTINWDRLKDTVRTLVESMNNVIDKTYYPIHKAMINNLLYRPIGIGGQGLHDLFMKMRFPWESEEAFKLNKELQEFKYFHGVKRSCELAQEIDMKNKKLAEEAFFIKNNREMTPDEQKENEHLWKFTGAYTAFPGSPISKGILQPDMWGAPTNSRVSNSKDDKDSKNNKDVLNGKDSKEPLNKDNKKEYVFSDIIPKADWDNLRTLCKGGIRNSLIFTQMPTATSSQILGNTEAEEALNSVMYVRNTQAGAYPLMDKHTFEDLMQLGLWDPEGKMATEIIEENGSIQNIKRIPKDVRDLHKTVWEISQKSLYNMHTDTAKLTCSGRSHNVFLANPTPAILSSYHMYAWETRGKNGSYYIRSKEKVKTIKAGLKKVGDESDSCVGCSA